MKIRKSKLVVLVAAMAFMAYNLIPVAYAQTTNTITQTTTAGTTLTLSVDGSSSLGGTTVNNTAAQYSNGSVNNVNPTDGRGSGAGWNVGVTATNLGISGANVLEQKAGGSGTGVSTAITLSGYWDGTDAPSTWSNADDSVNPGTIRVYILTATSSTQIPATASLTLPDGDESALTFTSGVSTPFEGLTMSAASLSSVAGDDWRFVVDTTSYNQLAMDATAQTPDFSGESTPEESTAGMSATGSSTLSGNYLTAATSSSRTDVVADGGEGLGSFNYDNNLAWRQHPRTVAGTYGTTLTYTITGN